MEDKLNLPADEIAFRRIYQNLLEQERLTTVFRPGGRGRKDYRGYAEGDIIKAKVLQNVGADWAGVAPEFVPDFEKRIRIISNQQKALDSLTEKDFEGSSPDVHDVESLRYHLGVIYNLSPESLNGKSFVTKIGFEYVH